MEKKSNVKMNINFDEEAVRSKLAVAAPRLGVPSVYETKPWSFLPQSGKGALSSPRKSLTSYTSGHKSVLRL